MLNPGYARCRSSVGEKSAQTMIGVLTSTPASRLRPAPPPPRYARSPSPAVAGADGERRAAPSSPFLIRRTLPTAFAAQEFVGKMSMIGRSAHRA